MPIYSMADVVFSQTDEKVHELTTQHSQAPLKSEARHLCQKWGMRKMIPAASCDTVFTFIIHGRP